MLQLPKVLVKLLPGLLPMSNNNELRNQVLGIVSMISRRVKSLAIPVPCTALLTKVVRPDMMPFAANIAISLIDISLEYIDVNEREDCAIAVLNAIQLFDTEFSGQTSALLNYTLPLLREVSKCFHRATMSEHAKEKVWAWLIDIALVQVGLRGGVAGSIQPGLSAERVTRLTSKREGWFLPDLSNLKLLLIDTLSPTWMDFKYIAAIVMVLVCDTDVEVSKQAVFKLNGLRSSLRSPPPTASPTTTVAEVVLFLLHMCLIGNDVEYVALQYRIPLREEVRVQALRWVRHEAAESLSVPMVQRAVQRVLQRVYPSSTQGGAEAGVGSQRQASPRYQAVLMEMVDVVAGYGVIAFGNNGLSAVIAGACLEALQMQVASASGGWDVGAQGFNSDENMTLRKVCLYPLFPSTPHSRIGRYLIMCGFVVTCNNTASLRSLHLIVLHQAWYTNVITRLTLRLSVFIIARLCLCGGTSSTCTPHWTKCVVSVPRSSWPLPTPSPASYSSWQCCSA